MTQNKSNKTTIYAVSGSLSKNGFNRNVTPLECEEKPNSYITIRRRISKNKIMLLDSRIINNHKFIGFHTFCLEGQQKEALSSIKNACIERANQIKLEFEEMYSNINL